MKKVIIIGSGIAGLSAGVHAQRCGFDVTIFESHSVAGGNCTSWRRGGYLFECGMHWLTGSNPEDPINQMWRSIGALNDDVIIHYKEPYVEYDYNGIPIRIYRDINKTEQHLLTISPKDEKEIKALCDRIRKIQTIEEMEVAQYELSEQHINRFSHKGIRELLFAFKESDQSTPMIFTLASLANNNGGFPEGGSFPFIRRIVKTFESLGGKMKYNTHVDRIIVENGKATGVLSGNELFSADAVIVASDTMYLDQLFDRPPKISWLDEMRAVTGPTMCTFVSLGINADLKHYSARLIFKLKEPIRLGDQIYLYLFFNNYASDPTYSPDGKTAMTVILFGNTYDFWKKIKEESRYDDEKQKVANQIITTMIEQMPEADGKIEICDVATPLTYERYCGTWKGSWMTDITSDMRTKPYPASLDGLSGVYLAGHRIMPPGGLPLAMGTGLFAVQHLCYDMNVTFVSD